MKVVHETLLYIVYNLQHQNQIITVDAIRHPLGWIQSTEFDLEVEITWLIESGFLVKNSENELSLTEIGKNEASRINKIRSKDDFNRLISSAIDSPAYLDYCEEIYGYRMPLFNMMDKQQLDYVFNTIPVSKSNTVLDLGCGAGCILNHLVQKYECYGIGIDQLNQAAVEKCSKMISFIDGDMDNLSDYKLKPNITLAVDSLYFSNDLDGLVRLMKGIKYNRLYFFFSQYIFDESKKDETVLHRDNTRIASILQKNDLQYRVVDYSANENSLYENALKVLPKHKEAFVSEGKSDLYETKLKENRSGKAMYDKGLASRYLYIVELQETQV